MDKIAVLSAGALTGFTRSLSTAFVSFSPWPVRVQTITAFLGTSGRGQAGKSAPALHFRSAAIEIALAGSTKRPSLDANQW
jgi:hypothetical protein